jgi:ring-1,2-phenylacetyl-CoA epoxidase subunit PaaC
VTHTDAERRPTRAVIDPDVPSFDVAGVDPAHRWALVELLQSMADDEFVIGFWDSEWTGIAPMLEEDVAFSSLAQDEIGHARVWYELIAQLTGDDADHVAFGRASPDSYRHCRLLDHPRTDWPFSVARRWLYDTADAVRLEALKQSSFAPIAEVVAKIRREERYHVMHLDLWLRRLADGGPEPRRRLAKALERLQPTASSVFTPLTGERVLVDAGILAGPMGSLATRWREQVAGVLVRELGFRFDPPVPHLDGRGRDRGADFEWLWNEFTMVYRSDPGATW